MTTYNITITNAIRSWGPAPSMRWGVDQWGTLWGAGTQDTLTSVRKVIDDSITCLDSVALSVQFFLTVTNSIPSGEDLSAEGISDSNGYRFVFPGSSTNAENRVISTYSAAAAASTTYSSSSAGTTPWS